MQEHGRMMADGAPDLDGWLPEPAITISHSRTSSADAQALWDAARAIQVRETALLGRLIQWRIPGTTAEVSFDELFRSQPFCVLEEGERALVSGIVGRIWTLRRDYPKLASATEFRSYDTPGTARVLFAMWAQPDGEGAGGRLSAEVRVVPVGAQGRVGIAAVRPLIGAFHQRIGSDGLSAAVRRAEGR